MVNREVDMSTFLPSLASATRASGPVPRGCTPRTGTSAGIVHGILPPASGADHGICDMYRCRSPAVKRDGLFLDKKSQLLVKLLKKQSFVAGTSHTPVC